MVPRSRHASSDRVLRAVVRALLILWAGFWAWFVLAVSYGGAETAPPWWIPAAWLTGLASLVWLGWRWPAVGGTALLAAGLASASYFDNPGARTLLAAPAVVLGLACLVLRWRQRSAVHAALLVLAIPLAGCIAAQDPADLPYRTSSILRHEDGRLQRAWLVEPVELDGYPCRRWVWWHPDGSLANFELSRDLVVQGHAFPEGTRIFFDAEGRLAHAWLSRDAQIDGWPCRGRWKIDTAFHPNGRVKAFFPPRDLEIDGVPCEASVFHPIYLHADGRLRQCKLADDVQLEGRCFEKGERLALDESGRVVR